MPYYDDPLAVLRPGFMGFGQSPAPASPIDPFSGAMAGAAPAAPAPPPLPPVATPPPPAIAPAAVNPDLRPSPAQDAGYNGPLSNGLKWLGGKATDALSASPLPSRSFGDDFPAQPAPAAPQAPVQEPQAPPPVAPQAAPPPPAPAPSGVPPVGIAALQHGPLTAPAVSQPDAQGGPKAAPSEDFYSTAAPPPAQFAPLVKAAADKYGVPENILTWVGSHESNWNPNATGIQTSTGQAKGMFQFMDGTAKQYGIDPMNPAQAIDGAAKMLSELAAKNGGDWTKAVQQYGTFSTGQGQARDQAAMAGFQKYLGAPAPDGTGNSNIVANSGVVSDGTGDQPPIVGPGSQQPSAAPGAHPDIAAMLGNLKSTPSQQLMALASGLLKGPTFGRGLGEGLSNVNALTQSDKEYAVKGANALALGDYRNNQLGLGAGRLGVQQAALPIRQQTADAATTKAGAAQQQADTGVGRLGVAQQGADTAAGRLRLAQEGQDARLSGSTSQAAQSGKDAAASIADISNSTGSDQQALAELQQTKMLIEANPQVMGPTLKARATRSLAQMGIAGDSNTLDTIQKMTADTRMSYLRNAMNGHVGSIRSNAELTNLSQAVAGLGTSPEAAKYITDMQMSQLGARQAWRQQLDTLQQSDPQAVSGSNYLNTMRKFMENYYQSNPLPEYRPGTSSSASTGSTPSTPVSGSYKGVTYEYHSN